MKYYIVHKTGRARSGLDQAGKTTHLKPENDNRALCGAKPGKLGGWSDEPEGVLTCPRCAEFEHEHDIALTIWHVDPSPLDGTYGVDPDAADWLEQLAGGAL